MRKLFALFAIVMLLASCATSKLTPEEKAKKQNLMTQRVLEALDNKHYTIDVNYVYPKRAPAHNLSYGFTLEVRGDSLISYLPYFGRAYSVPYGGGNGLDFTARMSNYVAYRTKKDLTRVDIDVENENDTYSYRLEIYDNGSASIDVNARERESISFSGEMVLKDDD